MMEIYHVRLRDALAQLIQSLQMAIKSERKSFIVSFVVAFCNNGAYLMNSLVK